MIIWPGLFEWLQRHDHAQPQNPAQVAANRNVWNTPELAQQDRLLKDQQR